MTSDNCRFWCTNAGPVPQGKSRRVFLLGAAAAAGGLLAAPRRAAAAESGEAAPLFAYIGCFTSERRKAHAKGISVYRIDANGSWSLVQTLETLPNPQFIAFDQRQKFLYSVHGDGTEVSSYAIDKASGRISFLNKQPTSGNNSTHLTPDPTNRHIVIGNRMGFRARRAQTLPGDHHAACGLCRRQHDRGNPVRAFGTLPLRLEPRPQQHRDLQRRSGERKAQSDWLGVDTRPHPAFLRSRSDRTSALRSQSRQ